MRHQTKKHTLGKAQDQRKALLRSLATELFTYGEIKTTMARAKALQPYAEHVITMAKKGDLNSRRLAGRYIFDKEIGQFIDTATGEITGGDFKMLVHIDVKHANVAVLKDKNASLDVIYTNHYPADDQYLMDSRQITRK